MRNATVFGPAPRMRFDLVLNNLTGLAWTKREIQLISDGRSWRPMIHICDLVRACEMLLEVPGDLVNGQIFNVGDDRLNYRVRDVAKEVQHAFPGSTVVLGGNCRDERSYKVSFHKIRDWLGFTCEYDVEWGAKELYRLYEQVRLTSHVFESCSFTPLKRLCTLLSSGVVDKNLYWRTKPPIDDDIGIDLVAA